jgi:hypothetical protein
LSDVGFFSDSSRCRIGQERRSKSGLGDSSKGFSSTEGELNSSSGRRAERAPQALGRLWIGSVKWLLSKSVLPRRSFFCVPHRECRQRCILKAFFLPPPHSVFGQTQPLTGDFKQYDA